jgi:diphosphomevalonate decarboxylase
MTKWFAKAPANIALIKYMGKSDNLYNLPDNPSLSYTLNNCNTYVELECTLGSADVWEPLFYDGTISLELNFNEKNRFLQHLNFLKLQYSYKGSFIVRSCNNFPHSSGLASSASSFAALTMVAVQALSELTNVNMPSILEQARFSRVGSGSSCRSFFSPWALWDGDTVESVSLPYENLLHQVILISSDPKLISSSEAHKRVVTSGLYAARKQRALTNLQELLAALHAKKWQEAYHLCWREFQDMHELFATATQSFSYINKVTDTVLKRLVDLWDFYDDGPIVTMDAGPNIHLLYRPDQASLASQVKDEKILGLYDVY